MIESRCQMKNNLLEKGSPNALTPTFDFLTRRRVRIGFGGCGGDMPIEEREFRFVVKRLLHDAPVFDRRRRRRRESGSRAICSVRHLGNAMSLFRLGEEVENKRWDYGHEADEEKAEPPCADLYQLSESQLHHMIKNYLSPVNSI